MVPAALLAYAFLAWLRPRLALGVLLFLIPFGHLVRFSVSGVPLTFPEIATYLLAAAILLQRPFAIPLKLPLQGGGEKSTWFRDSWVVFPLLWIVIAAVSAAYSPNALRAWGIWKAYFLGPVVLFWVIRSLWGTHTHNDSPTETQNAKRKMQNDWYVFVFPLALGATVVAAIAIAQRWWPIGVPYPWSLPEKFRATSVFGYPNAVGLYLAPLVTLMLGGVAEAFRPPRRGDLKVAATVVYAAIALISLLAITLAKSTGALVALAVAIPAYAILVRWSWPRRRPRIAASLVLGVWLVFCFALTAWLPYRHEQPKWGPPIVQKLTFQQWSGSVRLSQYRETWALLRDHPIRGAGLAGYQTAIAPYHEKQDVEIFLYPHNLLLAAWVELGLAGLLIFLAILYQFFRQILSPPPTGRGSERGCGLRFGIVAALLVILIHGLVDVPYFKNDLAMLFWVIAAFVAVSAVDRQPTPRVR